MYVVVVSVVVVVRVVVSVCVVVVRVVVDVDVLVALLISDATDPSRGDVQLCERSSDAVIFGWQSAVVV
jgi:hypothetical protein